MEPKAWLPVIIIFSEGNFFLNDFVLQDQAHITKESSIPFILSHQQYDYSYTQTPPTEL